MDERVLGDMPSEGSEGSRRFGIYSAYSPGPKMHSISRIRLLFVLAIAIVVAFAVVFPMVQYASRTRRNSQFIPYPEIANVSLSDETTSRTNLQNCSTNVLSFGLDCTEPIPKHVVNESESITPQDDILSYNVKTIEETSNGIRYEEDSTEIQIDFAETRGTKFDRIGRSRWPVVSTPYPYYSLPKPTPVANDRNGVDLPEQTNIFAIPLDMSTDNFSDYSKPRINFTPPPYAFTPFPNFTDSYAQLSPYKIPKNYTNFEEILKFLNNKEEMASSQSTEKSGSILNSRAPIMKVSGTYIMPLDRRRPGEIIVSSSENNEESRPFFNGHAYVTDPFLKFRPANPSEINRLIPIKSSVNLGPRFRKPVSFVPSSSVPVDLYAPMPQPNDYSTAASHTVAIFHPPPSLDKIKRPTTPPPKDKPLSVTLDIYPVTVESEPSEAVSMSSSTKGRVRGRLDPNWRPKTTERPRWRPQVPRRPSSLGAVKSADNHMIVHLNLFPNKRKQYTFPRRGRQESTTQPEQKTTYIPGGKFSARSDQEPHKEEEIIVENRGTTDSTMSTSGGSPAYSALSGFAVEEVHPTTPVVLSHKNNNLDDNSNNHSSDNDFNESSNVKFNVSTDEEVSEEERIDFTAVDSRTVSTNDEPSEGQGKEINESDNYEGEYEENMTHVVTESDFGGNETVVENGA